MMRLATEMEAGLGRAGAALCQILKSRFGAWPFQICFLV